MNTDNTPEPAAARDTEPEHVTLTGTLDPGSAPAGGAASIDVPAVLTFHLDGGLPPAVGLARVADELADGLLLDTPVGAGLTLHQAVAMPDHPPRLVSADGDDPGGEGTLFLFDAVNRTTVGVRADTVEQAREKIGLAFADEVDPGLVHQGVALRATSLWLLAEQPFTVGDAHHGAGDEATPALPWDVAHTQPQVTAVVAALREKPRPVPLWLDTPGEAEALLAALHTYVRLAPCEPPGQDCASHEGACERHGLAERLMERLTAAVLPLPDPDTDAEVDTEDGPRHGG